MPELLSFDVFDTCLVRRYAFPTDVFLAVAEEFRSVLAPSFGGDYRVAFRDARVEAEERAVRAAEGEDVTLHEIWTVLTSMLPGLDVDQGVEAELNTERKALRANPSVHSLVHEGRKKHGRVIFISDCYLPEEFLLEMLIEHGFFKDGDACYVSSATRKTKRNGSLFQYVLAREGIAPKHLRHLGDDYVGDYIVPTRLGINAMHYANGVFTSVEKAILRQALKADFVVASQLVADMKFFRLQRSEKLPADIAAIRDFAGSFIGPFLALFAAWVLRKAREDGVQRLYFLSRDCYALWLVASRVSHLYGGIECRYLYASRQALLLPAVSEISPQGMPWIRRHNERATLKLLLSKLELYPMEAGEGFAAWFNEVGSEYELSDEAEWRRFWSLLNEEPLRSRILELVRVRRDAALAYFRQEGLFDQAEVAIADLGWRATCQAAIRTLLRSENSSMEVRGYYLGLHTSRLSFQEAGPAFAMYHDDPPDRGNEDGNAEIFRRVVILEHLASCAPHGSVHHYSINNTTNIIEPVCLDPSMNSTRIYKRIVESVLEFCESGLGRHVSHLSAPEHYLDSLLQQISQNPDPQWAYIVKKIEVSEYQNDHEATLVSRPYTWTDLLHQLFPAKLRSLNRIRLRTDYWPEMSLLMTDAKLKRALRLRSIVYPRAKHIIKVRHARISALRFRLGYKAQTLVKRLWGNQKF